MNDIIKKIEELASDENASSIVLFIGNDGKRSYINLSSDYILVNDKYIEIFNKEGYRLRYSMVFIDKISGISCKYKNE